MNSMSCMAFDEVGVMGLGYPLGYQGCRLIGLSHVDVQSHGSMGVCAL